jgi:hypothetical protein
MTAIEHGSRMMSADCWAALERMARSDGATDAQLAGLAIGCPVHGNAHMDYDSVDDVVVVFCHRCPA